MFAVRRGRVVQFEHFANKVLVLQRRISKLLLQKISYFLNILVSPHGQEEGREQFRQFRYFEDNEENKVHFSRYYLL